MENIKEFFLNQLPHKIAEHPELVRQIDAVYQFDIEDVGTWTLDLTQDGIVREGVHDQPGCVVTANAKDFAALKDNPATLVMLFATGKIKLSNPSLAEPLQKLLK